MKSNQEKHGPAKAAGHAKKEGQAPKQPKEAKHETTQATEEKPNTKSNYPD